MMKDTWKRQEYKQTQEMPNNNETNRYKYFYRMVLFVRNRKETIEKKQQTNKTKNVQNTDIRVLSLFI